MTLDDLINYIQTRIAEIKAASPENDEAELYLQGCQEELERLLDRMQRK